MERAHRESADALRSLLAQRPVAPESFRAALTQVPSSHRDRWLDLVFGLEELPVDGPELPRGCVPYLPCPVDAVLEVLTHADVQPTDVFVDVGSGVGRAAALAQLVTGAASLGIEVQPALVRASRELAQRLNLTALSVIEGDATTLEPIVATGSVFFLYCPFSGERLVRLVDELGEIARMRPIRICSVDLPLPERPWLTRLASVSANVAVYRASWPW